VFTPLQVTAIAALEGDQQCVKDIAATYQARRDVLVKGLNEAGWPVETPKASMYVWARIPEPYRALGSLEFSKLLLEKAKVSVSPGIGFGDYGDGHVRFALIENRDRISQAVRGIRAQGHQPRLPSAHLRNLRRLRNAADGVLVHWQVRALSLLSLPQAGLRELRQVHPPRGAGR